VGARVIRRPGLSKDRPRKDLRVIATIIAAVALPMILALILVAADMRIDLSDLKPVQAAADLAPVTIGWEDLETDNGHPVSLDQARWQSRVRMLGYMMDGDRPSRDGTPVDLFVLMPEAGHWLHAAHRFPSQMVEIRLARPLPFQYRRLVLASGVLARMPGRRDPDKASYVIQDAVVEPAEQRDITRWFQP
jgi:hypothetical protein